MSPTSLVSMKATGLATSVVVPQMAPEYPLDQLDGLNIWYEARLVEEGVEDMQNLTTMNLVDMLLHTRAPVGRLIDWIDQDRKATPLKELQGLLWIDGYAAGAYRGHIYPEVGNALRRWHAKGIALYVYSSGSVAAQKLLFAHSEVGDLTPDMGVLAI